MAGTETVAKSAMGSWGNLTESARISGVLLIFVCATAYREWATDNRLLDVMTAGLKSNQEQNEEYLEIRKETLELIRESTANQRALSQKFTTLIELLVSRERASK